MENSWISVKDKLPPLNTLLILFDRLDGYLLGSYTGKYFIADRLIGVDAMTNISEDVTHWSYLLPPPLKELLED